MRSTTGTQEAGAGQGGRDGSQVQRGSHLIAQAVRRAGGSTRVIVLPDADDGVRGEHHRGTAGEQPVESVDEIRGVAGPAHHEPDQRHDDHPRQRRAEVTHEGQPVRDSGCRPVLKCGMKCQESEREADNGLPDQFGLAPKTEAALLPDLDEVVEESHPGHAHQEKEHQERGPRG